MEIFIIDFWLPLYIRPVQPASFTEEHPGRRSEGQKKRLIFFPIICPLKRKNCVYKYITMCTRQFKCCLFPTALFIVKGNLKAPSPGHKRQPCDVFLDFSFPLEWILRKSRCWFNHFCRAPSLDPELQSPCWNIREMLTAAKWAGPLWRNLIGYPCCVFGHTDIFIFKTTPETPSKQKARSLEEDNTKKIKKKMFLIFQVIMREWKT